jgi:two-component sensor histidine kinase
MQAATHRFDPAPGLATILPPLAEPSAADETNHRVANNLQLLCALIAVEEREARDPVALAILERTRQRIAAIAGVHRQLYTTVRPSRIDLGAYLSEMGAQIGCTCPDHRRVIVEAQSLSVDAEVASSIGLLAAELITNACKHAYAAHVPGTIRLSVRQLTGDGFEFCVEDQGRGVARTAGAKGLGSRLIDATVRKLDGLATWEDARPGLRFRLIVAGPAVG